MTTHKSVKRLVSLRVLQKSVMAVVLMLVLGLILIPAMAPSPALSQSTPQVLGKTVGQWSAVWWQWLISIPAATNPLLDTTGEFGAINQKGPVWFLAGTPFEAGNVTRNLTVPAGKYIFFPIVNTIWVKFPTDTDTESFIRSILDGQISPLGGSLVSTLDGIPTVFNYRTPTVRTQSPVFTIKDIQNPDNLFGGLPDGSIEFSDGFWVMLPPLKKGLHVLHFQAGILENVTYNLTVE